jgi:DNA-binding GntR family transcriptional regulator
MIDNTNGAPITLSELALDNIKHKILTEYKPGEFVSEKGLAKSLAISRTPIREALHQLASQGLVRRVPHVGSFVAGLSYQVVKEIMEVREALEGRAAGLATGNLPADEYRRLKRNLEASIRAADVTARYAAMEDAGQAVHAAVVRYCNNQRIAKALADLQDQIRHVQAFAISVPGRMEQSHAEHGDILNALTKADPRHAEWLMREHLEGTKETLLLHLQEEQSGATAPQIWPASRTDRGATHDKDF